MGPSELRKLLEEYGLAVNKGLGQNFLTDDGILESIADAADISAEDTVLEIGPGPGVLTEVLLARAKTVTAVELDKGMCRLLEGRFAGNEKLRILHGDILKLDIEELYRGAGAPETGLKVAANLPYYVTTPVLMHLLQHRELFRSITVMVQKEVAERMEAKPGSKSYGALSLAVQYAAKITLDFTVPPSAFYPMPKVTSAVVTLTPYEKPPVKVASEADMFRLIKAAFGQRRKMLANAAAGVNITRAHTNGQEVDITQTTNPECAVNITYHQTTKPALEAALKQLSLDPKIRGEELSLEQFAALSNILSESFPA